MVLCDRHWPKDYPTNTGQVFVILPMYLTALNEAYFPLFNLQQEKLVELIVQWKI